MKKVVKAAVVVVSKRNSLKVFEPVVKVKGAKPVVAVPVSAKARVVPVAKAVAKKSV
jgi:hypothetical protein